MMINGVNIVTQLNNVQNIRKTENSAKVSSESDSISVSKEAVQMAEAYYLDKVASETPDVRADRIAEVKAKIKDPNYLSDAVIMSTAEKFMTSVGL
jgi:negative regulator of flagellin synthesis FlgM